ncbi:prohibitin family protein [Anaerolineales bacterium HSG24]|nr:prohibitin family protein [Anaerolineales bacterium HSG24]
MNTINIDGLLYILTIFAWIVFVIWTVVPLIWRITKRYNIRAAFLALASRWVLIPLMLVLALNLLSLSIVFILPQEVGVVVSVVSPDGIRRQPLNSGLQLIIPLAEQVIRYPTYWQTYTMSGKPMEGEITGDDSIVARTSDGQEVAIDCSVIFRVDKEQAVRVHQEWQDRYIRDLVRPLTRGMVRDFVSKYTVDEVNSNKRQDLTRDIDLIMKELLEKRGFDFDQFLLRNIGFTKEYAAAVEQKQVAFQGVTQKKYEADQLELLGKGQARKIKELARGEAEAILINAKAQAEARIVKAEAEAKALQKISLAINEQDDLLTYQYINKLSPNLKALLIPNNAPLLLPLSNSMMGLDGETSSVSPTNGVVTEPITNTN